MTSQRVKCKVNNKRGRILYDAIQGYIPSGDSLMGLNIENVSDRQTPILYVDVITRLGKVAE
jgi:hypothetical protein